MEAYYTDRGFTLEYLQTISERDKCKYIAYMIYNKNKVREDNTTYACLSNPFMYTSKK